jgi:hypothetical protein
MAWSVKLRLATPSLAKCRGCAAAAAELRAAC